MAARNNPAGPVVDQLLKAVASLPGPERREFQRRFDSLPQRNGIPEETDESLIEEARACLPEASNRRLRKLIAKSEARRLTPAELTEYLKPAHEAEQLDVVRIQALAELSRRWRLSAAAVQEQIAGRGLMNGR
jgi:hypothetical protein